MPCSCKTKKNPQVIVPSKRPQDTSIQIQKSVQPQIVPQAFQVNKEIVQTVQYDFTPTVNPQQLCIQCTIKHLSFALILMEGANQDNYIAIGQLMCARYHLRQFNKATSIYFAVLIIRYLLGIDIEKEINQLIEVLKNKGTQADFKSIIDKNTTFTQYVNYRVTHNVIEAFQYLTYAYSLMFSQPMYQEINRTYAVGALSKVAYIINNRIPQLVQYIPQLRELWKKIETLQKDVIQHNQIARDLLNLINNIYSYGVYPKLQLYRSRDWSQYRRSNVKSS